MAPISIGEIHIPGGAGLVSARTLTLTSPPSDDGGLELFFGMFAADAPKRVVEKLCDRLAEEFRPVFFRQGDPEARFEAALKQANKTILAFLYEHGLSLPGVKLRGAVAALSGGRLFAASRGGIRGTLYVPNADALAPYALFDDAAEKPGEPKFFTSLQAGAFPEGARLVIATSELFQALDDGYVSGMLGQADFAKASREIKQALRAGRYPVSILALSSPLPLGADSYAPAAPAPKAARPSSKPQAARPAAAPIVGPDIGEVIARGLRAGFLFTGRALAAIFSGLWRIIRVLATLPLKAPRLVAVLASPDARAGMIDACRTAPDRCMTAAVERLNALPSQSRNHFLVLLLVGAVFTHGLLFSFRRELTLREAKAYEASLAELQRLEGDFEAGIIYENEGHGQELLSRMEAIASALPEETSPQQKNKAEAKEAIARAKEKLRRVVMVEAPAAFAKIEDAAASHPAAMAWFGDKLYVFSASSGRVRVISSEGAAAADPEIAALSSGVAQAAVARTGFILTDAGGKTVYWNPDTGEAVEYPDAGLGAAPILFYQSRLYAAAPDGTVTRRSVTAKSLGSPSDVLRGAPADPTGIATDGAIFLLYRDGSTRKYMKGAAVPDHAPAPIDPPAASAGQLWASADSDKLMFIDEGGDRAFIIDKGSGRLLAQMTAPQFQGLLAGTADEKGRTMYLLAGDGTIYAVPIK
ncbi:MAG TPA: hypothetical protein VL283_04390 [Candidatus Baltobacteraceae bacterium]|nr:hypothetical protein [Candidatus Baltobacteraceae bacterium]